MHNSESTKHTTAYKMSCKPNPTTTPSKQAKEDFLNTGHGSACREGEIKNDSVVTYHEEQGHNQKVTSSSITLVSLIKYCQHAGIEEEKEM